MSKADEHQHSLMMYFAQKAQDKYKKGVEEHGEGLWQLTDDELLEACLEEVIDMMHYLTTMIQNRKYRKSEQNVL